MPNTITIGSITTPNPTLYVNMPSLETSNVQYRIQSSVPVEWTFVNQFCSLLSIAWLNNPSHPAPFGITNFNDEEKMAMAARLVAIHSMDDQIAMAETEIHGTRKPAPVVLAEAAKYNVGTKIWAGNDDHVFGILIADATTMKVYDSNHGTGSVMPRTNLQSFVSSNSLNAFVVAPA